MLTQAVTRYNAAIDKYKENVKGVASISKHLKPVIVEFKESQKLIVRDFLEDVDRMQGHLLEKSNAHHDFYRAVAYLDYLRLNGKAYANLPLPTRTYNSRTRKASRRSRTRSRGRGASYGRWKGR